MGKQPEKKAATADKLFVFGVDDAGKPRGARFSDFNEKVVNATAEMTLRSVHPASAAFTEIAMKLPVGRLYASGKAFVPPIRRDLLGKLKAALRSAWRRKPDSATRASANRRKGEGGGWDCCCRTAANLGEH